MASAIIVFSHRRWDFVHQRPQQLLSRLAAHHPVVFVEEPVFDESESFLKTWSPTPGVLVCQPHTPVDMPGFHDDQLPYLQKLLRQLVRDHDDHIAWFCTPMALPLLQELHPRLVVYDCIEELAALHNAPRQLAQRESGLLKTADLVFADGQGLYRSRWDRHPNVHCLPSSVDAAHFLPALDRSNSHPAHREIAGPRLGFHGVIDERFDAELVGKLADAHAQWQIVLVGPVVGIDPASLPRRPNIHYLGQQPYEALPHFLAGWDICLLPYANNEASRFSGVPTVLEYMAAELPIVSKPVADVVELYGDVVTIAADTAAFIAGCEAALLAPPEEIEHALQKMREVVAATSWDATVEKIQALLNDTQRRAPAPAPAPVLEADANVNRLRQQEALKFARTVIVGAGAAGLSAAYHLAHDAVLLEKNAMVGGECRSIKDKGFTFDHGGHVMTADDPYVRELVELLLGSNIQWQQRRAAIYRDGRYSGCEGAGHSLSPYAGAAIDRPPSNVAALRPGQPIGPDARFGYPLRGGFQALMSAFVPHIKGTIELNADVVQVSPHQRTVTLADGRRYQYENLISTMPLPQLVAMIGDEAPDAVKQAAAGLQHGSVRCINIGVARAGLSDMHWIDFPQHTLFDRVFMQGNVSPECNAPGGFGLTCEIRYSAQQPLPAQGAALIERCVQDCIRVGLLRDDDVILVAHEVDLPYACVVRDEAREKNVATIRAWLEQHDILLAGRYAEWEDCNADQAFMAGKRAVETVKWVEQTRALAVE
jgi:protoporphyrinogen oxidase/glycosyltransferase involved in cell wall biosynthesis